MSQLALAFRIGRLETGVHTECARSLGKFSFLTVNPGKFQEVRGLVFAQGILHLKIFASLVEPSEPFVFVEVSPCLLRFALLAEDFA